MTSDAKKITVASIVGGVLTTGAFLYFQWKKLGDFITDHPAPAVLVGLALAAAITYGIVRAVLHRRHMRGRVRGPRRADG